MTGMVPGLKEIIKEQDVEQLIAGLRNSLAETTQFQKGEFVDFIRKDLDHVAVMVNGAHQFTVDSQVS
jgi:hypothetical protein